MSSPQFIASRQAVANRGSAPISFLTELVAWGKTAPAEIFAPNRVSVDAYTVIKLSLATEEGKDASGSPVYSWDSLLQRRAAMLELMRVHAGFESSWNWNEGVDKTNATSQANKTGQETGIFQVSFDSTWLDSVEGRDIMGAFVAGWGLNNADLFILAMKSDHALALEYYARLVRVSVAWAGPLIRHGANSVFPYLSRDSMNEFMGMLA